MKMTLRWFGSKHDSVTLKQIRQIPGVTGVITTLYDIPAGKVWPLDNILKLKSEVEASGLKIEGIESVNIHDSIKMIICIAQKSYNSMGIGSIIPIIRIGSERSFKA